MEVNENQNCLVTNIQYIFCVPEKKVSHTDLKWLEGEQMITIFHLKWR